MTELTSEQIAEIRERLDGDWPVYRRHVESLLAEVERLRVALLIANEVAAADAGERASAEAERDAALAKRAGLVAGVEALGARWDHFRDGLRARHKPSSMDRREANTWDVATYELRALLATHATPEADQ